MRSALGLAGANVLVVAFAEGNATMGFREFDVAFVNATLLPLLAPNRGGGPRLLLESTGIRENFFTLEESSLVFDVDALYLRFKIQ